MRILYISGDLGVEAGGRKGAATHIRATCDALKAFGHEVLLVTPTIGDTSEIDFPVLEVKAARSKMLGADGRYLLLNYRMKKVLEDAIINFRPDAVYERYSLYQTAGEAICRRRGLPRILEVNTLLAREQSNRLRFPRLAQWVERRLWRREKAIIAVSTMLKRLMVDSAGLDIGSMTGFVICPVAVNPARFSPATPPADLNMLGADNREVVAYIGTLTAWHGVDLFFEAARILRDADRPTVIMAVGGEDDRVERLRIRTREEGVESHLLFLGSIPHSQVPALLAAVDVCLIPDTQDWSSPTKFFEFAAMQKPVVAARSPAVEEVFGSSEQTGVLFERGNAQDMVRAIESVLDDARLARRIGRASRRHIMKHYTWARAVQTIMRLYRDLGATNVEDPPAEAYVDPIPAAYLLEDGPAP